MSIGDGSEPIADDEIVYRRVSDTSGWYDPNSDRPVAWAAFRPNEKDLDGISVWRAKYKSPAEVAATQARPERRYFILVLRAARLRESGIEVKPSPQLGGPGHATLANLNKEQYERDRDIRSDRTRS